MRIIASLEFDEADRAVSFGSQSRPCGPNRVDFGLPPNAYTTIHEMAAGGEAVRLIGRLAVVALVAAVLFGGSWQGIESIGFGQVPAVTVASALAAAIIALGAVWAQATGSELTAATPDVGDSVQTAVSVSRSIVGKIPHAAPAFQDRQALLAPMAAPPLEAPAVIVITGQRGVGKTQLAASRARTRINEDWRLVAWINAEEVATTLNGLVEVAEALQIYERGQDLNDVGITVRHWLEADGKRCLIVFDNNNDLEFLRDFIPVTGDAEIVITSIWQRTAALGQPVLVDIFSIDEARTFLSQRTGKSDDEGAASVAHELGFLPLALAHAAAVIVEQHLDYASYLARLRSMPLESFERTDSDEYTRGVAQAILLSLAAVAGRDASGLSTIVIELISLFSAAGVWRVVLYKAASSGLLAGSRGDDDLIAEVDVDRSLGLLANASLIAYSADEAVVSAHRLVTRVIRERIASGGHLESAGIMAVRILQGVAWPLDEVWLQRSDTRVLVTHIVALYDHLRVFLNDNSSVMIEILPLRLLAIRYLQELDEGHRQAIEYAELLEADCARVLGDIHPLTLSVRNRLAVSYREAFRVDDSIALEERNLINRRQVLGEDHPDTLSSQNSLACSYYRASRLVEAIELFEKTLAKRAENFGADDLQAIEIRSNLASAYWQAGRVSDAIGLAERVLGDRERLLGEAHPDTLSARNNLANEYRDAGRVTDAVRLLEANLADRRKMLGEDHADTLDAADNLANAYWSAGRASDAVELYERNLADRRRVFGDDDPQTLWSWNNLAWGYLASGRIEDALGVFEANLGRRIRILGEEHRLTLLSYHNLAYAHMSAGHFSLAISLYNQVLAKQFRLLGEDHPDTLDSRHNLAQTFLASGEVEAAISRFEQLITDQIRVRGPEHPEVLKARHFLACSYMEADRVSDAISLFERTLTERMRILGPDHPETLESRRALADARRPTDC